MAKTDTNSNTVQILILVALALLVGYLLSWKAGKKAPFMPNGTSETITSPSDLDKAQDNMDAVNVDAIDSGLNQLNNDANRL